MKEVILPNDIDEAYTGNSIGRREDRTSQRAVMDSPEKAISVGDVVNVAEAEMSHAVKGEEWFELAGSKGRGMSGEKHQELGRP
jgi:hypothetical protein